MEFGAEEMRAARLAQDAESMAVALWEINARLRALGKHGPAPKTPEDAIDLARAIVNEELTERGLIYVFDGDA